MAGFGKLTDQGAATWARSFLQTIESAEADKRRRELHVAQILEANGDHKGAADLRAGRTGVITVDFNPDNGAMALGFDARTKD